ncbi:Similar to PLG: Plasminogen (Pongo abelii), partial [Cotesia congregata]
QQAGSDFTRCKFSQLGGDYVGTIAVTKSGIRCQMWTGIEQIHKVDERIRDIDFPDGSKSLAKNYCRNPTNDSRGLWCYTIEKSVEIEECDIPLCNYQENRVTGTGVEYGGKFKTSLSQKECKFWKTRHTIEEGDIATQTKRFPNTNFPEQSRERAKNYCRNPDGDNGGPWCYVDGVYENIVNKEYCDVPLADDRDCLVYTRSIDSYSTITKLDYSNQNITVWIKLWNPTFNYKTMATLLLSHVPVPATGKVIAELWKAGAEIAFSNTLTGLIYPGLNLHTNFKHTPHLITGENWTAITISWSLGYVTISLANSTEIIYAGEYAVKDSLSTLYPDGFLYYGLAGEGILWSTDLCLETCEIHTTFGYRYLRTWPIHSSYKSYSINFFLRSSFAISIQLYQTPGVQFPYFEIKMTQKGLITIIYQETSELPIHEIKNVESSEVLDYWTWEDFTISIFGSDLYILVHKYYGGVELLHVKYDLFKTVRWFSIGSERIAHWTLYCTPENKDLSEETSPPNCIASKEEKYEGAQWFTKNFFPCALWSSDMVPNDQKEDHLFPDGSVFNATNKCRKINFDAKTPYCYALWDSTATTAYKSDCLIPACRSASCRVVGTANDYIGTLSETRSGRRCALWLNQPGKKGEKKYLNDTLYPEQSVKDASNYCRNPSQSAAGTWCYTTDPLVTRDLCQVKDCDLPGEYIFLIKGDNIGRRMYILPKYRVKGIKINVKIWIPDDPDLIKIVFDADDGLNSSYKLIIGAENNSKILLYYKSEEKDYELVKEQISVHILFIARWSQFIIKIPRGKVQIYRDATSLLFEWEHEDPLKSFLPIYYYFSTEKNLMALSYDCVSTCHVEITTTNKIEKFFPIFSEDDTNYMHPQKLEFMIISNGDVQIPLILFPEDFEYYVLKIGQSTSTITLFNSYMTFLFQIVEKKSPVEQLLSEKEWSNITISWVNRTMQVFWNTIKLLDYEHTHPFVFYFFSVKLRTGFAKWTVNCLPPGKSII